MKHRDTAEFALKNERFLSPHTVAQLMAQPKPVHVAGVLTPETLDDLTFGDLMNLQGMNNSLALVERISTIILHTPAKRVLRAPAGEVYGLALWVGSEVERINKLFEAIKKSPTDEERRAGVGSLNFGVFGMADWYARRMGMTNQDEALLVKWVRVYECMRIDNEVEAYGRRYREIISKK